MNKELLLIFTRNPELGKCKTRLAATVGNQTALDIYVFLLEHTVSITRNLQVDKQVHYSVAVRKGDLWNEDIYQKKQQLGDDLGERMLYAFQQGFINGYDRIIVIGSDMYDLSQKEIEEAFKSLDKHDYVVGPAIDGGYYLLGMKELTPAVFHDKEWGTSTVLKATKNNLKDKMVKFLTPKNDIDVYEDAKSIKIIKNQFLN